MGTKRDAIAKLDVLARILERLESIQFVRNPLTSDSENTRIDLQLGDGDRLAEVYIVPTNLGIPNNQIDNFNNSLNVAYEAGANGVGNLIENKMKNILQAEIPDIFS